MEADMTATARTSDVVEVAPRIEWGPVIAGAISASALAFVLHGFATAIGISVSSTAPTWRDASFALVFLSGLYLLLVALASYGFGAYVAGRLRRTVTAALTDEANFRDGMHGILVWALATLLAGLLALAGAQMASRLAPSGDAAAQSSVAGENIIAFDLDRLFRGERRSPSDMNYIRAEAARILMSVSSHRGMLPDDRSYLVRLVAANTGLSAADADRRVTEVSGQAKHNIDRARASLAIIAFMMASAALLGAAFAWVAASAASRHLRAPDSVPEFWRWSSPLGRG
jgi:hypothetical protein